MDIFFRYFFYTLITVIIVQFGSDCKPFVSLDGVKLFMHTELFIQYFVGLAESVYMCLLQQKSFENTNFQSF